MTSTPSLAAAAAALLCSVAAAGCTTSRPSRSERSEPSAEVRQATTPATPSAAPTPTASDAWAQRQRQAMAQYLREQERARRQRERHASRIGGGRAGGSGSGWSDEDAPPVPGDGTAALAAGSGPSGAPPSASSRGPATPPATPGQLRVDLSGVTGVALTNVTVDRASNHMVSASMKNVAGRELDADLVLEFLDAQGRVLKQTTHSLQGFGPRSVSGGCLGFGPAASAPVSLVRLRTQSRKALLRVETTWLPPELELLDARLSRDTEEHHLNLSLRNRSGRPLKGEVSFAVDYLDASGKLLGTSLARVTNLDAGGRMSGSYLGPPPSPPVAAIRLRKP